MIHNVRIGHPFERSHVHAHLAVQALPHVFQLPGLCAVACLGARATRCHLGNLRLQAHILIGLIDAIYHAGAHDH